VREIVRENLRQSISHRSQELDLSAISTWRILRRDLSLHLYKIQLTQELKVNDHRQRRVFTDWVLEQLEVNPNFPKQIILSPFLIEWICEQTKLSNLGINPREIHQMHPEKVTVWCGFSGGINSPSKTKRALPSSVAGERYRSMISNFLWPKMDDMDTDITCDSNRMALYRMLRWTFCTSDLRTWLFRAAVT